MASDFFPSETLTLPLQNGEDMALEEQLQCLNALLRYENNISFVLIYKHNNEKNSK